MTGAKPRLLAVLIAGALLAIASAAAARPPGARVDADDTHCPQGAVCGTVMRPLDPSGAVQGQLAIAYRLYPHTGPNKAGTIVAQEGGPGYTTTGSAFGYLMLFEPLRPDYDILMVNARGTGATAIACPSLDRHPVRTPDDVGECGRLLGRASVLYGTRLAAEDMKAVLDTLHITQFNLYGDSYGTFFSQVFVALYPSMLRSVVLDGTFPVIGQSPWYPENAYVVHTGFDNACLRSPYCASLPGHSLARIRKLVDYVRATPLNGSAPDAEGVMRQVTVDTASIGLLLFGGSGPLIYRDLDAGTRAFFERGDALPLLRMVAETAADFDPVKPRSFSYGLFAAVSCMDYQQIYDMQSPLDARRDQRHQAIEAQRQSDPNIFYPLGIDEFRQVPIDTSVLDLCVKWPVHSPPYPPGQPIPAGMPFTSAPTLVINGELDTLTAPGGGAIVAAQFPNATHVIVANSYHVDAIYDTDDCAQEIVRRFIATLSPGDISCASNIRPGRLVPIFVKRALDAIPADPQPGNMAISRDLALASAAVQTAGDAIARWYINYTGQGAGLRGGRWSYVQPAEIVRYTLRKVLWADDLPVSGTATWNTSTGAVEAMLTYENAEGEPGYVTAVWNDRDHLAVAQLSGSIGKRTIHASMPAP